MHKLAPQTIHAKTKPVTSAGAYIATMSLAITQQDVASRKKSHAKRNAAVTSTSIMKFNAADTYHSTILKLAAEKSQNTMKWMIAKPAKDGFAISSANMFLNITGNISAVKKVATYLALSDSLRIGGREFSLPPTIDTVDLKTLPNIQSAS